MEKCREILLAGISSLELSLSDDKIDQLLHFVSLLAKWNKAYNLTAIRNTEDMTRLHLLDSLAIAQHFKGMRIIDIATGAGLPGIPLAITLPESDFTLLDSNAKKTRFVQQVVLELKLKNVTVIHQRAEDHYPEAAYPEIICRAFTNLADMLNLTGHLLTKQGTLFAMKGKLSETEIAEVSNLYKVSVIPINVPGIDAERCLIKIQTQEHTEDR